MSVFCSSCSAAAAAAAHDAPSAAGRRRLHLPVHAAAAAVLLEGTVLCWDSPVALVFNSAGTRILYLEEGPQLQKGCSALRFPLSSFTLPFALLLALIDRHESVLQSLAFGKQEIARLAADLSLHAWANLFLASVVFLFSVGATAAVLLLLCAALGLGPAVDGPGPAAMPPRGR